jgi:hypothetical protein
MMTKSLDIKITPDGILIDAVGFKGTDCDTEMQAIEKELEAAGIHTERKDRKVKAEYYVKSGASGMVRKA